MVKLRKTAERRPPTKDPKTNASPVPAPGKLGTDKGANVSKRYKGIAPTSKAKRPRRDGVNSTSSVIDPGGNHVQDPFHRLSTHEVALIFDFLPVEATHTARLVSKLWKASSEFHNTSRAIRRHFPESRSASATYDTWDEANVQFRRLLYHQQSLKQGIATRATKYTCADFWDLKGNTLLWANRSGSISVRDLRSAQNGPSELSNILRLNVFAYLGRTGYLLEALLIANGDLLVHISASPNDIKPMKDLDEAYYYSHADYFLSS
ncbi:hypothetical protein MMC16_007463 [Acarospora aff. strigata]|nr:hypothetical protein [Acarospora aff. strigata]